MEQFQLELTALQNWRNVKESLQSKYSKIESAFQAIDVNQSGSIELSDLEQELKNYHQIDNDEVIQQIFEQIDTNKDQKISLEEFEFIWTQIDQLISSKQNKLDMTKKNDQPSQPDQVPINQVNQEENQPSDENQQKPLTTLAKIQAFREQLQQMKSINDLEMKKNPFELLNQQQHNFDSRESIKRDEQPLEITQRLQNTLFSTPEGGKSTPAKKLTYLNFDNNGSKQSPKKTTPGSDDIKIINEQRYINEINHKYQCITNFLKQSQLTF